MGKAPLWGTPHPLSLAAAAAKHSPCLQPTPSCLSKNCDRGGSHKGCSQAQGAPSPLPAAPDSRRVHSLAVATSPPKQPLSWAPAPGGSALQAGPGDVDMQECAAFQAFELEEGEACPTPPGGGAPAVPSGSEPLSRSIPRWFVYLRMQCGSSEFIRGDVEGGFLPGVPWSAPKPACECPQPSRPQGSWFGPCRPLPASLQVFCL